MKKNRINPDKPLSAKPWKEKTRIEKAWEIIFESDTFWGRVFDEILLLFIILSIVVVMLESMESVRMNYGKMLYNFEWFFTIVFTIEYIVRIIVSPKPKDYIFSFLGIVDFLAIIPTYIAFGFPGAQTFIVIRSIRLLRIYRILKLYHFVRAGNMLLMAVLKSLKKISIFMIFILILVILLGSIMYVVEGAKNGFTSIPVSIYWAVITLTTVGYGDIVPMTALGKFISTFIMLLGYSIIAIPTGIVSVEMARTAPHKEKDTRNCKYCDEPIKDEDANFCKICGSRLD
ncbi:MAG: ion transporter [Bacteroides sp.]|jgi:voltage-gated potassium channel|nr:ion transporter [Bacteroides sp.]